MYMYTIVSKFHETVDCIKTKLKIVTSMQFKLCTASWLEWGGHSVQKCLQGCAANMGCKIKMVRFVSGSFFLQNLVPKITESVPKEHKFSQKLQA